MLIRACRAEKNTCHTHTAITSLTPHLVGLKLVIERKLMRLVDRATDRFRLHQQHLQHTKISNTITSKIYFECELAF
jgi:hypothetical protein